MSESSNSGVLSRALLLPLRRISLISSSSEVGSFAIIPAKENTPCQAVCWEKKACSRCSEYTAHLWHSEESVWDSSTQEHISKGAFRIRTKTQSYHWCRACRVGGSSLWLLSPFSRSPTAEGKWEQLRIKSFLSGNTPIAILWKPQALSPEIRL